MSQTPTPGFDNEPEDWWPSEVSEEGAGESLELEGQPPGPVEGHGDRGEADGGAGGIPVDPAPFDEDEQQAPASGRGEPARGDDSWRSRARARSWRS